MGSAVFGLILALCVSAVCALADWRRGQYYFPPSNIPRNNRSKLSRVSTESHWHDPRWLELDIIYPVRRYRSPVPGPPIDRESPTYVHPVHLTKAGNEHIKSNPNAMRQGVDAMMDALLSVRRVNDTAKSK